MRLKATYVIAKHTTKIPFDAIIHSAYSLGVPRLRQGPQTGEGHVKVGHQAFSKGDQKIIVDSNESYALAA